jgi:hypothetical protein
MDEQVRVNYPEERDVYIDGNLNGKTNEILRVGTGTHIFSLGEPKDYTPESCTRTISDTTPLKPEDIDFSKA